MKIEMLYGMKILNPTMMVKILPPPPLTKTEIIEGLVYSAFDLIWPPFLFALSVTCFRLAFGGF